MRYLLTTLLLALTALSSNAQSYDAAADFDPANNPSAANGWSYGQSPTLGGAFSLVAVPYTDAYWQGWYNSATDTASVMRARVSRDWSPGGHILAGQLSIQPTSSGLPAGKFGVVRWACPSDGSYEIATSFLGVYTGTSAGVYFLINGNVVFSATIIGQVPAADNRTTNLLAGDHLDWVVGTGSFDRSVLDARLTKQTTTVSGVADLEFAANPAGQTANVQFRRQGTQTVVFSSPVTLDSGGNFSIALVPVGTWDVAVKFSSWLRQVIHSFQVTTTPSPIVFNLPGGDAFQDNKVDLFDLNTVMVAYGTSGVPGFDPADVNWDGTVGIYDLNITLINYGLQGMP